MKNGVNKSLRKETTHALEIIGYKSNNPDVFRLPPPGTMWAQRPKHIILTICLTDVKDPVIKVEATKLYFKGVGGTEMKEHEVEMEFFKNIDVEVKLFSRKCINTIDNRQKHTISIFL